MVSVACLVVSCGVLSRHGDGPGDKRVAEGSSRLRVQVLGHDRDLAEVASSQRVFVFDPADECCLVRLNTHTHNTHTHPHTHTQDEESAW